MKAIPRGVGRGMVPAFFNVNVVNQIPSTASEVQRSELTSPSYLVVEGSNPRLRGGCDSCQRALSVPPAARLIGDVHGLTLLNCLPQNADILWTGKRNEQSCEMHKFAL